MFAPLKIVLFIAFFSVAALRAQTTPSTESVPQTKETKLTEVITTDSVASSELVKRAIHYVQVETPRYVKSGGVSAGSKAECHVAFAVKPKELNPVCDYSGKINMRVIVECKDSKYKYTIDQIKHVSLTGKASMGGIDNIIPECGSMIMPDLTQKKLKGEALKYAGWVANDIKEAMKQASDHNSKAEW